MKQYKEIFREKGIPYLAPEDYQKAVGQFRLQLNAIFQPFQAYGLDIFVPGAISEVVKLSEDFALRCRGLDKPISIEYVRRKR